MRKSTLTLASRARTPTACLSSSMSLPLTKLSACAPVFNPSSPPLGSVGLLPDPERCGPDASGSTAGGVTHARTPASVGSVSPSPSLGGLRSPSALGGQCVRGAWTPSARPSTLPAVDAIFPLSSPCICSVSRLHEFAVAVAGCAPAPRGLTLHRCSSVPDDPMFPVYPCAPSV